MTISLGVPAPTQVPQAPTFLGTGLVTGPYLVLPTQSVIVQDPHVGKTSDFVQVQNQTGINLTIYSGANVWAVTSSQSTTIPLPPGGRGITISTNSGYPGLVTVVWMLNGQVPPQPDGPLTMGQVTKVGVSYNIVNQVLNQAGPTYTSGADAINVTTFAVSFPLTLAATSVHPVLVTVSWIGQTTGNVYGATTLSSATGGTQTVSAAISGTVDSTLVLSLSASCPDATWSVTVNGTWTAYYT